MKLLRIIGLLIAVCIIWAMMIVNAAYECIRDIIDFTVAMMLFVWDDIKEGG